MPLGYNSRQERVCRIMLGLVPGLFSIRIISLEHGRFCTIQERKKQHSLPRPSKHLLLYYFLSRTDKKNVKTRDIISVKSLMYIFMGIKSDFNRTTFQVNALLTKSPNNDQLFSSKIFLTVYEIVVGVSVGGIHALFGAA